MQIITADTSRLYLDTSNALCTGWVFREENSGQWLPAEVPGTNFTDLFANGLIEDPFFGSNEKDLQWVENKNWEYRCSFHVEEPLFDSDEIELVFLGLDTYARVILNGNLILESSNMFVEYKIPCKKDLVLGLNKLTVIFDSPILQVKEEHRKGGITYPAENDKSEEKLSVFTRKAPYQFGWDWGPRMVTSGIWREVYLQPLHRSYIKDVHVVQHWEHQEKVNLKFDVNIKSFCSDEAVLVIDLPDISQSIVEPVQLLSGSTECILELEIRNPRKWWPNGSGEQFLHKVRAKLFVSEHEISSWQSKIGLREVKVVREKDNGGETFYLQINGEPIFMKGANYIPSDSFLPNVSKKKYKKIFEDAVESNMNMLRIWGGGIYETTHFYELADEHGILIWQDFMFSCSLYPGSESFFDNVRQEVAGAIKRLRNHACLALWCGNNEIEMGMDLWDWPKKFGYSPDQTEKLHQDYKELFYNIIPSLVEEHDPNRYFLHSSPTGFSNNGTSFDSGDSHYWGVWHGEEDFTNYRLQIPRFMSEFGFQSFPLLTSVRKYIPDDERYIDSDSMLHHQKNPGGNNKIVKAVEREYGKPKDFESLLYLSQLVQAEGLKVGFEAHREAKPFCMGSLYWQMNDCWPVTSWSSIDYYGNWKALHYQVKRSFQKLLPLIIERENSIILKVVNDALIESEGSIVLYAINPIKGIVKKQLFPNLLLKANSVVEVGRVPGNEWSSFPILYLQLISQDQVIASNYFCNCKMNELELPKPEINFVQKQFTEKIIIKIISRTFVKGLYINIEGCTGHFSDNFIDLMPNEQVEIEYYLQEGDEPGELKFLSVYDALDL